jgi:Helix-turn-helix domain
MQSNVSMATQVVISVLITPEETAKVLNTTPGVLAVWRCEQRYKLPYVKIGSKVMYRVRDVEEFITSRTMPGVAEQPSRPRRHT